MDQRIGLISVYINAGGAQWRNSRTHSGNIIRLEIAPGGGTATMYINGSATDSSVAAAATASSAGLYFGDMATGTTQAQSTAGLSITARIPIPSQIWLTSSGTAGYANRIKIENCQINSYTIGIADDDGYGHSYIAK